MILKSGTYDTDIASLKLGVDGLSLFIPNGWGDGCWDWFLVDSSDDIPEGAEDGLCFQGKDIMVFNSEHADGLPVAGPFSGSFMAHAFNGDIYIEIIDSDAEYWGPNTDAFNEDWDDEDEDEAAIDTEIGRIQAEPETLRKLFAIVGKACQETRKNGQEGWWIDETEKVYSQMKKSLEEAGILPCREIEDEA